MAFQTKTDFCGLSTAAASLSVKDSSYNGSNQKYQPTGTDGSYAGTEVFGSDAAPTNNYALTANLTATDGMIKLGTITTADSKKFALESVSISTGAAAAPTVSATCQLVESGANDASMCHYSVPAFALTTKQHAQILFTAFSLTGSGCVLTACNANIGCTVGKDTLVGSVVSSDVNSGVITVTGTILQTGDTVPTVTATTASGWVLTKPPALSESNPETAYKTYNFEVERVLAKDAT